MKRFVLFFLLMVTPIFSSQSEGLSAEVVYKILHNCSVGGRYSFFRTIQKALDADRCETITIAPGTYYENLLVHRSVTLTGSSGDSSDVIIDGSGADRIINVTTGTLSITLKNLTLQNGSASAGSAFYATGGVDLSLKNVVVQNNVSTGNIGAIYVVPQTSVILDTVTCSVNSASSTAGSGGCLLVGGEDNDDTVTITNSTFSENITHAGGAVYFSSVKTVSISDSTFENNEAAGSNGGAINYTYNKSDDSLGSLNLQNVTCKINMAQDGGCLYAIGNDGSLDSTVTISNSTFASNEATTSGGGAYTQALNVDISESTIFDSNTSGSYGGGYMGYNPGTVTLSMDDTEFTSNESDIGGALWAIYFETISISKSNFDSNLATTESGAVHISGFETATLDSSTLSNNSALLSGGLSFDGTEINLTNLLFYKNEATDSHGGALVSTGLTEINLSNSTFSENTAVRYGGAVYLESSDWATATLSNTTFYKNQAHKGAATTKGAVGGGIYVGINNIVYIERSVFSENEDDSTENGDCEIEGEIESYGYNRDTDRSCNFTEDTDDTITDAGLEALADNGGPTLTHMLSSDSVLIDAGGSDCTGTDQRGASWPVDGDASATAECDIGAVEYGSTP